MSLFVFRTPSGPFTTVRFHFNSKLILCFRHHYLYFCISVPDGDQCEPDPCLHGGNCTDRVGGFLCSCPPPHYGPVCELGAPSPDGNPPTAPLVTSTGYYI